MAKILVIDDDKDICVVLSKFLVKHGFQVEYALDGGKGLALLKKNEYDLVLCDYRLPDTTGIELLQKIKLLAPDIAVVIITGYADVKSAVETFRYGANDYVTKPLYPDELVVTIRQAIAKTQKITTRELSSDNSQKDISDDVMPDDFIVGESGQAQNVQRYIDLVAPSDMSLIIIGETGTGKEYVARAVHAKSRRHGKPFVAIDCGALPRELAASELFGHLKGSFTGAIADKKGSFEIADGGTLFLDEIGNLSYENQVKLLRVLQEKRIKRIGATRDISVDVRIIAATSEDLRKAVSEGKFREDLYHRLNEFQINISPLRERKEDIVLFAKHFLRKANRMLGKNVNGFSPEATARISQYYWHGNLRELNNVVKRAVLLSERNEISVDNLPAEITSSFGMGDGQKVPDTMSEDHVGLLKSIAGSAERQAIIDVLEKVNYNKSKAAELLNIDRKTLYNKLKLYDIQG